MTSLAPQPSTLVVGGELNKIDQMLEMAESFTNKIIQSSMNFHIQHKKAQRMQWLNKGRDSGGGASRE